MNANILKYPFKTKIATKEDIIKAIEHTYREKNISVLSFYSSDLNLIIDDPAYMIVPIDERMINRCHGIFDSMLIKKFRFHRLKQHLERFEQSALKVGIKMPMSLDKIKEKMVDLSQFTYMKLKSMDKNINLEQTNINMRIWLSSGKGDFGIYSYDKTPIFYACTYIPNTKISELMLGVKEYTIQLGTKEQDLIKSSKSTSYLENAIIANSSKSRGGYLGLKIDENGSVLEASIANIAIVLKDNQFLTTPGEKIVEGTTLKKCIQYIHKELIPNNLVQEVKFEYFNLDFIYQNASEVILFGGDKIIPVLYLNDIQIGNGKVGKICSTIQKWYASQGDEDEGDEEIDVEFLKDE